MIRLIRNQPALVSLTRWISARLYRISQRLKRIGLAWRFAIGSWSEDDATRLRWASQDHEGFHPLEAITYEGLQQRVSEDYDFLPAANVYLKMGVSRTAEKWCGDGETSSVAYEDAQGRAFAYAADDGVFFWEKH